MISMAIQHQEDQKAITQDIYKFIRDSFPYYRDFPDRKWQNVVRYTLSTNDCFVKVKPNHGRKYFSSYWIIHKDSHSWLTESNHMRRFQAFKISDIVCPNQVITSQNKTTDKSECMKYPIVAEFRFIEKLKVHKINFNSIVCLKDMDWMTLPFPFQLYPHQRDNHTTHVRIHIQFRLATI